MEEQSRKYLFCQRKERSGLGLGVGIQGLHGSMRSSDSTGRKNSINTGGGVAKDAVDLMISSPSSASAH